MKPLAIIAILAATAATCISEGLGIYRRPELNLILGAASAIAILMFARELHLLLLTVRNFKTNRHPYSPNNETH